MNQKLSIKTDKKYLRLMEWWPKEGQERCSRCCFQKDDADCIMVCSLCKPSSDDSLTGLETGGYFQESEPRRNGFHKEERRNFSKSRDFKRDRDFKRRRREDSEHDSVRRDTRW